MAAETRILLFPMVIDSPTQVVPDSVTFTLSSILSRGGFGRLGHGILAQVILLSQVVPSSGIATANSGYIY